MKKKKASLEDTCKKDIEMFNKLMTKETDIGKEIISSPEQRSSERIEKTLKDNNESSNKYSRNANYVSYGMFLIALFSFIFTYTSSKNKSEYQEELKKLSLQIEHQRKNNQKIIDFGKRHDSGTKHLKKRSKQSFKNFKKEIIIITKKI